MPKKFEGHGSGEVEVKTGKMQGACEPENSLLPGSRTQRYSAHCGIIQIRNARPLAAGRLSTDYAKREYLCFQIPIKPQVIFSDLCCET